MKGNSAIGNDAVAAGNAPWHPSGSCRAAGVARHLRNGALAVFALAGLFVGGFGLFAHHIGALVTPDDPESADAIVVLTGGQSRIGAALDLLKSGKGKRLLISGVNPVADADDLRVATGAAEALFSCCVDIDHAALNTIGNAEESAKWMRANAYDTVILVTNNYHMPRSLLEMRRYVNHVRLEPYPVVNTRLDNGTWMTKPRAIRVLFTEYTKFLAAVARTILPAAQEHRDPVPAESTIASRTPSIAH
jgi:uncharacterized SAM-binding protein YcdF (DUF218 family)